MIENRLRELRKAKGLSQKQLAQAAQTSQQQIQRIEAGNQHARFDLVTRICAALGDPVGKVFPSTALPLARLKKRRGNDLSVAYEDEKARDELEEAGMDMEPAVWRLKYQMRGGAQGDIRISGPDVHRIDGILQDDESDGFVVLDSPDRKYALNLKHLIFCHLLFDTPGLIPENTGSEVSPDDEDFNVEFYLADRSQPLRFGVAPDRKSISDDDADALDAQLQDLLYYANMGVSTRLTFVDENGERAFFRRDDISLFSVASWLIEPNTLAADDDEEEEEESAADS